MKQEIVGDIRKVAGHLGLKLGHKFGRSEYLNNGANFSHYDLYDGGMNFSVYCETAGYKPKTKEPVPDEVYFERLQGAYHDLGRLPKTSEREKFGLNINKRRWPTLDAFIKTAISKGIVKLPQPETLKSEEQSSRRNDDKTLEKEKKRNIPDRLRRVPAIPELTKRKKWQRIPVDGFPYAPQDESGVIALFAILCSKGCIPWQILELRSCNGIDGTCYDDEKEREIRVELKHILSRSNWNHQFDDFDYLVCWENRWSDFPKPVLELKSLVKS